MPSGLSCTGCAVLVELICGPFRDGPGPVGDSEVRTLLDAIVVGAGPAGCQTALSLAAGGHDVLLIDYRSVPGDKLCAGIVGKQFVERYGVPASFILHEARGADFTPSDRPPTRISRSSVQAYVIDRVRFVSHLADKARSAGVTLLTGTIATAVRVGSEQVEVTTRAGGRTATHSARAIVMATGAASALARRAGLHPPTGPAIASQAVVAAPALDTVQVFVPPAVPGGYFGWLVPQPGGRALLGLLGRHKLDDAFTGLASTALASGLIERAPDHVSHWPVPLSAAGKTVADRALLVGDAAGQVKPTTGGGIYYSMRSGELAAKVLSKALDENDLSEKNLLLYEKEWRALLGREMRVGRLARAVYEKLDSNSVNRLIEAVASNGLLPDEMSFDWHADIIVRALGYRLFDTVLAPLRNVEGVLAGAFPRNLK